MLSASLALFTLVHALLAEAQTQAATSLASQYSLTTSTSIPFPTATLANSDAQSFITSGWSLNKNVIQTGGDDVAFVADPFPDKPVPNTPGSSGPVLQVTYNATGFSTDTSGTQLYSLWGNNKFQSMVLSYEVAFDANFPFNKGGKLPGLRGGPEPDGCSGGSPANGTNCFSSRVMWRTKGEGEGASF